MKVSGNLLAPSYLADAEGESNLLRFAASHRGRIQADFERDGVVLFRHFEKVGAAQFAEFARIFCDDIEIEYGDLSGGESEEGVYRSTVYPEALPIHLHNEAACSPEMPTVLFFHCEQPAEEGGATRIADSRLVLDALPESVRRRLDKTSARYIRNHHPHLDTSWQSVYQTGDPRAAEQQCQDSGVTFNWLGRDVLQTQYERPVVATHPESGEQVLTHQLFLFSQALLDEETREALASRFHLNRFPRVLETSPKELMSGDEITAFFEHTERLAVDIQWQEGDVVMIDNLRFSHGRAPFVGARNLHVAMGKRVRLDVTENQREERDPTPSVVGQVSGDSDCKDLSGCVRSWASKTPDAVAIESSEKSISYDELIQNIDIWKQRIVEAEIREGQRIGLCGPVTEQTIYCFLALWELGAVVVPLDVGLPRKRRLSMEGSAEIEAVIEGESIELRNGGTSLRHENRDHAVVFFTSGTTGTPKGIIGSRAGISEFLCWQRDEFSIGPGDRFPQLTGLSFDVILRDIFVPLVSGATLCLTPDQFNLASPWKWLADKEVTRIHAVPSLMQIWLSQAGELPKLKTVFSAGEPLEGRLVRRLGERTVGARIVNLYGPAETTLARCFCDVTDVQSEGVLPIGRPLPRTRISIIDDAGTPVREGATGEIAIEYPHSSHGYLDGPTGRCGVVYRTGDLGRIRTQDGLIDILGRVDDQVKIRGVRIQPVEVASVLSSHGKVSAAFVCVGGRHGQELIGYFVGDRIESSELRDFLEDSLPQVMVPSHFVWLEEFPVTANGKIDRRRLPAPALNEHPAVNRGPENEPERQLVELWSELLDREIKDVGLNFFEAGGFSLSAAQLAVMIEERWSVRVQIQDLFEAVTIAEQARLIGEAPRVSRVPILSEPEKGMRVPATPSQHRMWFAGKEESARSLYNIPGSLRFSGSFNEKSFNEKLDRCLQFHRALFVKFTVDDGQLFQDGTEPHPVMVERRDLTFVDERDVEGRIQRLAREQLAMPFDLSETIWFRGTLFKLSESEHVFVYVFSHLMFDGWSHRVFLRDLFALMNGDHLEKRYSFLAFANCAELQGDPAEESKNYWREQFRDLPPCLDLPFKCHPSEKPEFESGHFTQQVDPRLHEAIKIAAVRFGATPFMVHLAALTRLFHEVAGPDVCVGTPVANRPSSVCEDMVGCFINTLAIRSRLSDGTGVKEHVETVRNSVLEAFAHQDVPFDEVVRLSNPERASWHAPLFQVLLNLLHEEESVFRSPDGLKAERVRMAHAETKFFLTVYVHWKEDSSELHFAYHAGLFRSEQISEWVDRYVQILEQMASDTHEEDSMSLSKAALISSYPERAYQPDEPESITELLVADTWRRVLQLNQVQRTDHFYELGGHSILAMQVMDSLSQELGRSLSVHLLEDFPTLHALAFAVENEVSPPLPEIEAQNRVLISSHQEWIRRFQKANPDSPAFLVPRGMRISGEVDETWLQRAASCVIERHPMLRTVFLDGTPQRKPVDTFLVEVIESNASEIEETLAREVRRPIDPDSELPFRLTLYRLSEDEAVLLAVAHHLVADCWSMGLPFQAVPNTQVPWSPGIFFRDLFQFYEQLVDGREPSVNVPTRTYDDYLAWQEMMFREGLFEQYRKYWDAVLEGAPRRIELPFDRLHSRDQTFTGARVEFNVPAGLYDSIRDFSRRNKTTPYAAMLRVFCETLELWSGNEDFLVGTPVPNRSDPQISDVIGLFSHTLLIRYREGEKSLEAITRQISHAQRHAAFPVESYYADGSGESGLIQVRFVLQQAIDVPSVPEGWEVEPIPIDRGISKYDVSIVVAIHGSEMRGWFEFDSSIFEESTIQKLADRYLAGLESIYC